MIKVKVERSEFMQMCCSCNLIIHEEQPIAYITKISGINGSLHICKDCINGLQNDICDELQNLSDCI